MYVFPERNKSRKIVLKYTQKTIHIKITSKASSFA